MLSNTIDQIKKFRADAIFEKKKHYNAAERKKKYHNAFVNSQIIINAITGTTLLGILLGEGSYIAELVALFFTIISTILAGLQKTCQFDKQSHTNMKVADMYLNIAKKINLFLAHIRDNMVSDTEIVDESCKYQEELSKIKQLAAQSPTNNGDYQKARKGIEKGEENYTELDMMVGE